MEDDVDVEEVMESDELEDDVDDEEDLDDDVPKAEEIPIFHAEAQGHLVRRKTARL